MFRVPIGLVVLTWFFSIVPSTARAYDPLALPAREPVFKDFVVKDETRSREIPLRVYLPVEEQAAPVILFSHGLGGSKEMSAYLGEHWSRRGYVVVFMQHPGSDDSVWRDKPVRERMAAMRRAASAENFNLRVHDVPAVLDDLETWNAQAGHVLFGRLDLDAIGMSGHSFGAVTTQAVSGQSFPAGTSFTDPRIKAACAMSPSVPRRGDPKRAFGDVSIPWLLMTGTRDTAPIGEVDAASRLLVFPALPKGAKYELVLDNAEHSAFTDRPLPGESHDRNANHHKAILAISTAFWDATLKDDGAARAWIDDADEVRKVLEPRDRWQAK